MSVRTFHTYTHFVLLYGIIVLPHGGVYTLVTAIYFVFDDEDLTDYAQGQQSGYDEPLCYLFGCPIPHLIVSYYYYIFCFGLVVLRTTSLSIKFSNAGSNHFSSSRPLSQYSLILPCSKQLLIVRSHPVHSLSLTTFLWCIWYACAKVCKR